MTRYTVMLIASRGSRTPAGSIARVSRTPGERGAGGASVASDRGRLSRWPTKLGWHFLTSAVIGEAKKSRERS